MPRVASLSASRGRGPVIHGPSYSIGGQTFCNVGSALTNLDGRVTAVETNTTSLRVDVDDLSARIDSSATSLVRQDPASLAISVGASRGGTSVSIAGTDGTRVPTGLSNGAGDADAVTIAQLKSIGLVDPSGTSLSAIVSLTLGNNASASGQNSVAIGTNSVADRDNTVSVGAPGQERQITNVAAATAPTDAVNVQQLNDQIGSVRSDMDHYRRDASGGIASGVAIANLPQASPAGESMVAITGHSHFHPPIPFPSTARPAARPSASRGRTATRSRR